MTDEEYQKEYEKEAAKLEAAAQATTARGADGKFTKAEPEPEKEPEKQPEKEPAKEPEKEPVKEEKPDEIAELRARVEKAEKIAKDNQAWATRLAQERAQEKREREQREREAQKPAVLDANPGLEDAIRYVAGDPRAKQQEEDGREKFAAVVEKAHPGIFSKEIDPELEKALETRLGTLDEGTRTDPLEVIRVITEEKLAFAERQLGKRFAAEAARQAQKSAMSVPGAGAGQGKQAPADQQLAEVQRIRDMSPTDFAKEVARVKGC